MLHSYQLWLFLSSETVPSEGSRDVIGVRMDLNCRDILSSFLLVLPFSLGSIKVNRPEFFGGCFYFPSRGGHTAPLERHQPGQKQERGQEMVTHNHAPSPHLLSCTCTHCSDQSQTSANMNPDLITVRSRLKLLNQGFKKKEKCQI